MKLIARGQKTGQFSRVLRFVDDDGVMADALVTVQQGDVGQPLILLAVRWLDAAPVSITAAASEVSDEQWLMWLEGEYEIQRSLVVSDAHMRRESAKDIENGVPWGDTVNYGYRVYAGQLGDIGKPEEAVPDEVAAVCELARQQGCTYVIFDCDGYTLESLPVFDW